MSFLQPWMLFGLPLVALPVVIHLVHRNRHQSVRWAAMRFLVEANRMDRGMARLRHYLILLARMVAVAALLVAASRPLLSGTIGGNRDQERTFVGKETDCKNISSARRKISWK